jgi:hypothetical protein
MDKTLWVKYFFSIWIVAIVTALVSKFVTSSAVILIPLGIGLYYASVKFLASVKGY